MRCVHDADSSRGNPAAAYGENAHIYSEDNKTLDEYEQNTPNDVDFGSDLHKFNLWFVGK